MWPRRTHQISSPYIPARLGEGLGAFAKALRDIRKSRGLSQEDFSDVSSRTYLSSLERDLKNPTIGKLVELCQVMKVHPLTLLTLAFTDGDPDEVKRLLSSVDEEINLLLSEKNGR